MVRVPHTDGFTYTFHVQVVTICPPDGFIGRVETIFGPGGEVCERAANFDKWRGREGSGCSKNADIATCRPATSLAAPACDQVSRRRCHDGRARGAYPAKADEQLDRRLDRIEEYLEMQEARQALADLEQYRAQVARERAAAEAERAGGCPSNHPLCAHPAHSRKMCALCRTAGTEPRFPDFP